MLIWLNPASEAAVKNSELFVISYSVIVILYHHIIVISFKWSPTSIYHIFKKQTMSSPKFSDSDSEPETSNLDQRASRKRKSRCEDDVDVGKHAS